MSIEKNLISKFMNFRSFSLDLDNELCNKLTELEDSEFSEKRGLIFEIIKDYHNKLFPKFKNSFELFEGLMKFESEFLYEYLVFYRDHFIHSFQIFLLGCYIIDSANQKDMPLDFLSKTNVDSFLRTWFLISFYHDIGYFVQNLAKISQGINNVYFSKITGVELSLFKLSYSNQIKNVFFNQLEKISKIIIKGEKNFYNNLIDEANIDNDELNIILNELIQGFDNNNHGLISSLFLFYTLRLDINFLKTEYVFEYLKVIDIACSAIATHDIEKSGKIHLDFKKNPFGCLLILCDNIQEWSRPDKKALNTNLKSPWQAIELDIVQSENRINFIFEIIDDLKLRGDEFFNFDFEQLRESLIRIFINTYIKGPNFSFLFKNNDFQFTINIDYDEEKNYYIIRDEI